MIEVVAAKNNMVAPASGAATILVDTMNHEIFTFTLLTPF
jgi:hypothetical protein